MWRAVFFCFAAFRLLPLATRAPTGPELSTERQPDFGAVIRWLGEHRQAFLMLALGVLAGTANFAMVMLAPRYTAEVLENDPSNAVYIFWTSGFGLALGLLVGPYLIRLMGEWSTAVMGFALITASLFFLGVIDLSVDFLGSGWA